MSVIQAEGRETVRQEVELAINKVVKEGFT